MVDMHLCLRRLTDLRRRSWWWYYDQGSYNLGLDLNLIFPSSCIPSYRQSLSFWRRIRPPHTSRLYKLRGSSNPWWSCVGQVTNTHVNWYQRDAVYEARKVRKARMEEYLSQKQCDITCSFLRHHRCLSAHERNLKKAARAEADPKVILV